MDIQLVHCAVVSVLLAVMAQGCMDPPNLYARYPSPIHRYFSKPRPSVIETIGGFPDGMNAAAMQNLIFRTGRGRHRLGKRRNSDCGDMAQAWGKINVEDRALCKWHYVAKHNSTRYPNIVVEAESTCRECVGIEQASNALMGRCEPVYRSFPVLERTGCKEGIYQYEQAYISVKVAFACAIPRMERAEVITNLEPDLFYY